MSFSKIAWQPNGTRLLLHYIWLILRGARIKLEGGGPPSNIGPTKIFVLSIRTIDLKEMTEGILNGDPPPAKKNPFVWREISEF